MQPLTSSIQATNGTDPAQRRGATSGSLLLVLFVLAALPPVTLAEGLDRVAVLELLGSHNDAPRREPQREIRSLRNLVSGLASVARPWISGSAIHSTALAAFASNLRAQTRPELDRDWDLSNAELAHVRLGLRALPPPM